ncbi:MAG: hypothetical protein CVV52_16290 [Spirochaetae bacterium HGW-Spirochaetae-8]|nr:MAG: hypothetical protein CVV52_16290 [Spirochaetae bacterium HGW-Spirochaetae-8]
MVVVLAMMVGCDQSPRSKALIIINDGNTAIDLVQIRQYIVAPRTVLNYNALADGDTIAPGEEKTFYLAPYSYDVAGKNSGWANLTIQGLQKYFSFDYLVNGRNEPITATYDGTTIVLSGSNVAEPNPI